MLAYYSNELIAFFIKVSFYNWYFKCRLLSLTFSFYLDFLLIIWLRLSIIEVAFEKDFYAITNVLPDSSDIRQGEKIHWLYLNFI